jgi:hypothetical protein
LIADKKLGVIAAFSGTYFDEDRHLPTIADSDVYDDNCRLRLFLSGRFLRLPSGLLDMQRRLDVLLRAARTVVPCWPRMRAEWNVHTLSIAIRRSMIFEPTITPSLRNTGPPVFAQTS